MKTIYHFVQLISKNVYNTYVDLFYFYRYWKELKLKIKWKYSNNGINSCAFLTSIRFSFKFSNRFQLLYSIFHAFSDSLFSCGIEEINFVYTYEVVLCWELNNLSHHKRFSWDTILRIMKQNHLKQKTYDTNEWNLFVFF